MSEGTEQQTTFGRRPVPWPTAPPLAPPASADPVLPPLAFEPGTTTMPRASHGATPPIVPGDARPRTARGLSTIVVPAAVIAAVVAVGATFLTWLELGASERTSYQVVRAAERLHVVGGLGRSTFGLLWAFLPLAIAVGGVALALGRQRLAGVVLLAAGLVEASFAALVLRAPGLAGPGAQVGLAAGLALAVLAVALLFVRSPRSSR